MAVQFILEARDITKSQFVGKDFDTWITDILSGIEDEFGSDALTNLQSSGFGVMWVEILANLAASLSWSIDREADETTLYTAILRESIVNIARHHGYKPYGAVPALATLTLTLDSPCPGTAIIPVGSTLTSENNIVYETISEVTFLLGEVGPKVVLAREGQSFEEIFTANSKRNQVYRLESVPDGRSIAEGTVEVRVGGVLWTPNKFLSFEQADIFEVELGRDPPLVRFGDGIAGNIPKDGLQIIVKYFATSGTAGSVLGNTITSFDDQILAGVTPITVNVAHLASTSGSDRQSLADIKTFSPLIFQTGQRGVTQLDLDSLINTFVDETFGAVAIGRATVPRSAAEDGVLQTHIANIRSAGVTEDVIATIQDYFDGILNSNCEVNVVNAQILAQDSLGRYISADGNLAQALEAFLSPNDKVVATVVVQAVDGSVNLFSVNTEATVTFEPTIDSEARRQEVLASVDAAIRALLVGREFGISLMVSDFYSAIESIEGVKNVNFKISGFQNRPSDFPARIDDFGNLNLGEFEVFSMGELPVVQAA